MLGRVCVASSIARNVAMRVRVLSRRYSACSDWKSIASNMHAIELGVPGSILVRFRM